MMNAKRLNYLLIGLLLLAVGGSLATVWYGNNWLKERSNNLVDRKLEVVLLREKQERALDAQNTLTQYGPLQEVIEAVAPKEKEQEKIIAELFKIASENNISIKSLNFPTSELGTAAGAKSAISQTEAVDGLTGVVGLQISPSGLKENGFLQGMSFDTVISFLEALERNRRQMIVNEVAISPLANETGETIAYDLSLTLTALIAQ